MLGKLLSGRTASSSAQIPLSFKVTGMRELRFDTLSENEASVDSGLEIWRLLSHQIRRNPYDLRAHTQRILLTQHEGLQDRTSGSLLDLFLALGNSGLMLRTRMLDICRDQLDEETVDLFDTWLQEGAEDQAGGWMSGSMLSTGEIARGSKLLKQQRSVVESQYTDVLAEIQDHIEYGQIDLAQTLLESEILEGRATAELEQELLAVYQHTRNSSQLEAMSNALIDAGVELSETWQDARVRAENW
ncbi:MAG: Unknown protein [uncultured Thiotrichaceae bacterium]|uniref:Uncharacterized protein n=1 Tax=uncultured Thiotrichaceae bacterium TaxID=298394 RepID=A0A6S6U4B2_9GAMM|nr:MAG: Unknown protein [uncultured Thiotrichaceae bacterium]